MAPYLKRCGAFRLTSIQVPPVLAAPQQALDPARTRNLKGLQGFAV